MTSLIDRLLPSQARAAVGGLLQLGVWGAADQALLSLSNFITLVFVARGVGPSEFGSYSLALTLVLFAMSIQAALLNKPYVVLSAERQDAAATREYVTSVLYAQVGFAVLINLAFLPIAAVLFQSGREEQAALLFTAGLVILAWGVQEYIRQVLYVERRLKAALANDVVSYGGQLALVVAASTAGVLTPVLAFNIIALTSFAAAFYGLKQIRHSTQPRVSWRAFWRDGLENWRFGRWMIGTALLVGTVDLAYLWLVAGFVSVAAAGALRAVIAVMGPTHILLKTMDMTVTPIAARTSQSEGAPGVRRLVGKVFLVTGPVMLGWCLLVSVTPGRLLDLLYGSEYTSYAWLLPLGALSYAIGYGNKVLSIALVARKLPQALFRSQLVQAAFFWVFGVAATYFFGLTGAAVTLVGSSIVQGAELLRAYRHDVSPPEHPSLAEMVGAGEMRATS